MSVKSTTMLTRLQNNQNDSDNSSSSQNNQLDAANNSVESSTKISFDSAEISFTAYFLGIFLGVCLTCTFYLIIQLPQSSSLPEFFPLFVTKSSSWLLGLISPESIPWQIPIYGISLFIFHFLEYYTTAAYNPARASRDSFLLRNGAMYMVAHAVALFEASLERYFLGFLPASIRLTLSDSSFMYSTCISLAGFLILVTGQLLRSAAMIHASSNFSHAIVRVRDSKHRLVTTGVYSFSRHPSYSGFFFWALGTQVLLVNPISFLLFWVLLSIYFKDRIEDEEVLLIKFFGNDYIQYKQKVPVRIPFI